ncbi:helix-turn-helix transcriptional regulator, partial [Alteromonas sp. K632G]|uniref:winged helix-turn-helix transcriptional regulator n=1 Tax=Alteromonas sp. K632G TaxID=2820757 RepID=UPI001AD741C1
HLRSHLLVWSTEDYVFLEGKIPRTPLWELSQTRLNFRGLQEKCGNISPTVLNKRLKQFRALNFIDHNSEGYGYTEFGKQLSCHLLALESWANQWAKNQAEGQND